MWATGDRGTTLIEALVTVAIVGLVSVIGFPRLQQGLLAYARHQTLAGVAARLRETRAEAISSDGIAVFAVAADGSSFGSIDRTPVRTPSGVTVAAQDSIGRPTRGITFFGDGSSTGGAIWVSGAGHRGSVVVAPAAGAIAVGGG